MEDQAAITRLKQGDLSGLETLVRRYQARALGAAFLVLHDRTLSEEIVQNVFIKICEKIHQFDESRPFAPWFFRIVINDAVKTAQQDRRFTSLEEEADDEGAVLKKWMIDPQPLPEEQMEIDQNIVRVRNALLALPPKQRAVVVMHYYLDMDQNKMAAQLKQPINTVKWWLRAARNRLHKLITASEAAERPLKEVPK